MNSVGIKTGWTVIEDAPDFFSINLTDRKMDTDEEVMYENAIRNHLVSHKMVIMHDPQPLPIINYYKSSMADGSDDLA